MKRIFKKHFLLFYFLSFFSFIVLPIYSTAEEEDDDDIEWLDEEGEDEELSSEKDTDEKTPDDADSTVQETSEEEIVSETEPEETEPEEIEPEKVEPEEEEVTNTTDEDVSNLGAGNEDAEAELGANSFVDEYERQLYETYIQYYSKRVSQGEWNEVIGNKDTYVIQPKDTLWDVSRVLFGDPNYWPKLWSVNPFLTNPHLIQPNNSLGFIHGTEGTPPSLTVIQGGANQAGGGSSASPPPLPDFLKKGSITVPPSNRKIKPILKNIPSSLPPLYSASDRKKEVDTMGIEFKKVTLPTTSFLHYYMSAEPLYGQGIVSDKKEYGSLFHVGQRVILEMREPVNPGQRLIVVKDMGKLYPSSFGVRGPFGYQIEVQGEVEIIGRVMDSFDLYEAKVTKSLNPIAIGSLVLNRNLIEFDYQTTDLVGNSEAQIIGVPGHKKQEKNVASPYSLVYLNRGLGSGMSVGQMYQIKTNLDIKKKQEYGYDVKLGEVKIVYVNERFATGLITEMSNPIYVGDYIVSLHQGLSTKQGYDPLEDEEMEGSSGGPIDDDDIEFEEFENAEGSFEDTSVVPETSGDDPYGDEDAFEAFE